MRSAADAAPSFLYLSDLADWAERDEAIALDGEEARYLSRVVRARDGERVTASDGQGLLATLEVERVRPDVRVRVLERHRVPPPAASRLLCGAPEGERGDWLVEKLSELGVSELVLVDSQRARWPAAHRIERWERLTVAALRQSRSAWRMRVSPPVGLAAALGALAALEPRARWLADPDGTPHPRLEPATGPVCGAVGPSSGFEESERKLLSSHDFVPVRLARTRLRAETAAIALAALWAAARAGNPPPTEPGPP